MRFRFRLPSIPTPPSRRPDTPSLHYSTHHLPLAAGLATAESEIFTSNPCEDQIEVRVPLSLCETVDCSDE